MMLDKEKKGGRKEVMVVMVASVLAGLLPNAIAPEDLITEEKKKEMGSSLASL